MTKFSNLRERIQTSEVLLDLELEELGLQIVQALRDSKEPHVLRDELLDIFYPRQPPFETKGYPKEHSGNVEQAIIEAWSWLEAQGFLVWSSLSNGSHGWRRLSRRAMRLKIDESANFSAAIHLPRELLHPSIQYRVWSDFVRGHYDSAVLFAAKQVEISVREASGAGNESYGVTLVGSAFNEVNGVLSDPDAHIDERKARRNLFVGFIGGYKNPLSHRDVNIDDPKEAIELVMMASHLLRITDLRRLALAQSAEE